MTLIRFLALTCLACGSLATAASYTVKAGDTLYSIAKANHIDPEALMKLNKLASTTIQVGQNLNVGGGSSAPAKAAQNSAPAKPSPAQAGVSAPASQDATVRAAAFRYLNIPYQLGGNGDGSIDCSGYTRAVYKALGISLPRTARAQYGAGSAVSRAALRMGDLVFFNTMGSGVSHVGIYIGGGQFTNANSYYGHTMVDNLSNPYWASRFVGARRVLPGS